MEIGFVLDLTRSAYAQQRCGGAQAEPVDGSQGEERSIGAGYNAALPGLWLLGIVCNPTQRIGHSQIVTNGVLSVIA